MINCRLLLNLFFILFISVACISCNGSDSNSGSNPNQTSTVQIRAAADNRVLGQFNVEIADDPGERSMGLMFRESLAPNAGMLFIFEAPSTGTFWMRNTSIPLDIIFIDADLKIIFIGEGVPFSEAPVGPGSNNPYLYVLEINQGRAAELGITVGDLVDI